MTLAEIPQGKIPKVGEAKLHNKKQATIFYVYNSGPIKVCKRI
jgi:hypothetical protein